MDVELANPLRDERNIGNKGDRGWKSTAYNHVVEVLSAQIAKNITPTNVKDHVKLWKKYYGIVSDILGQSGFNWDSTNHMITVDDDAAWNDYVKANEEAGPYRYKRLMNWDDIVDLCGKDRATGNGAKTSMDYEEDDVVAIDNDTCADSQWPTGDEYFKDLNIQSPTTASGSQKKKRQSLASTATSPPKKKIGPKKEIVQSMNRFLDVIQKYLDEKPKKFDTSQVFEVVSQVEGIDDDTIWSVCDWLLTDEAKFNFFKNLHPEKKMAYIAKRMPKQ